MSLHRASLFAATALLSVALPSLASAGDRSFYGSYTYGSGGCGGCGGATVVYAQPVPVAPPVVTTWGGGCGCHRSVVYAAPASALEVVPVEPAPIYVVNQGPDYSGPGIMVPYRTWTPPGGVIVRGSDEDNEGDGGGERYEGHGSRHHGAYTHRHYHESVGYHRSNGYRRHSHHRVAVRG